ncbi:MAG: response regulator [Gammaproteobacteria bacterium]
MSPREVARMLMVKPVTVRSWALSGMLPSLTTPGRHRRFRRQDVDRFAAAHGIAIAGERLDVTPRVLVVDDERAVADYLAEFLNAHGASAAVAYDGFDAGRKVQGFRPDILLLDLRMPRLDGFEVCAQLKADAATRDIRILAMTGVPTRENSLRILAAGAEHCFPKPLDHTQLLQVLGLPPAPPARRDGSSR